ncbi:MAG TPA: hypothetical protein VFC46_04860 [Humisphaera sp.]|nr:hypothetical protein [Humisphaera sp.]
MHAKWLEALIVPAALFGPSMMTNNCGTGSGAHWGITMGVILVSGALVLMWKMLLRQATEIERLKGIIGAPTDQTV